MERKSIIIYIILLFVFFFFQAEDGIRDHCVTGVQTCALPIYTPPPSEWKTFGDPIQAKTIIDRRLGDNPELAQKVIKDYIAARAERNREIGRASCRERV